MIDSTANAAAIERRIGVDSYRWADGLRVERRLDVDAWRDFVARHPQGNVFHTPEMFEAFSRVPGYRPSLWAAVDDHSGDVLALLTPVQIALSNGPMSRLTSRDIAYGSLLTGRRTGRKLCPSYRMRACDVACFELRNLSSLSAIQPLLGNSGFIYEDHLDFLVDLSQPEDVLWQRMSKSARKHIRRAQKHEDLAVVEAGTSKQLSEIYSLLRMTYDHARIPLADFSLFQALFEVLRPRLAQFFVVLRHPIAGSVELLFNRTMYGFYGGADRQFANLNPTELLQWRLFQWGQEHGYSVYDFGGAGKPDEEYGVRDFKAKFGGDLVNYGRNVCVHAPRLLEVSKRGYAVYRRLMAALVNTRSLMRQTQPRLNA